MHKLTLIILFVSFFGCDKGTKEKEALVNNDFPKVLTTYKKVKGFDADFKDLVAHGIDGVDIGSRYLENDSLLVAARKYNIKILSRIEVPKVEVVPKKSKRTFPQILENGFKSQIPESAVMIGGAYKGKAIDRFTFVFENKAHQIVLEKPVYHKDMVYNWYGHYFPGMYNPEKVEVIVKEKDFDGKAHVKILPAGFNKIDENHWQINFDLSEIPGKESEVIIAAYWILHADLSKFRNNPSAFAQSTHDELRNSVKNHISTWKKINHGKYPDEVIALRFGDEEWHRSAHVSTSESVSYPVWDYSNAAIANFQKNHPYSVYPRGQNFAHIFGRMAYANWFYDYHNSKASLVKTIKEELDKEGLSRIKIYRNTTRSHVFSEKNDHDGSGQEAQSKAFDIIHLDPYPARKATYTKDILIDMAYMSGFARRFNKPIMPWLQAHEYYPDGFFGLIHPSPDTMKIMIEEHKLFQPDAIMWLGYGPKKFNTFPLVRPESWEAATVLHEDFKNSLNKKSIQAKVAVIRPYTIKSLRDDMFYPQDYFFTDIILKDLILRKKELFDPFEPLDISFLNIDDLKNYKLIISELGILNEANLKTIANTNKPSVIFMEGCEMTSYVQDISGIKGFDSNKTGNFKITDKKNEKTAKVVSIDIYNLDDTVKVLAQYKNAPVIWKKNNIIFVSVRSDLEEINFAKFIWEVTNVL